MTLEFLKFGFSAGELSPTLQGRTDLEKYDLGLALSHNWFIDYRGGLTTRSGLMFLDFIKDDDKDVRLVPFQYAPDEFNAYALMFGDFYLRFVQDGAYVLEAAKTITGVTQASPGVVTSATHGFSAGDWVKITGVVGMTQLNGRTFRVGTTAANTFQLLDPLTGASINTAVYGAYVSGGTASRIYTIATPYPAADLQGLNFSQYRDLVRITHEDYAIRELVRGGATSWALTATTFGTAAGTPSGITTTPQTAGTHAVGFTVTSVNFDGEESISPKMTIETGTTDFTSAAGAVTVRWSPVANARSYNVYATTVHMGGQLSSGAEVGYIGRSFSTTLQDKNIVPDFTKTPPIFYNPFVNGGIDSITITNNGTGYTSDPAVSVGGGGSGFSGFVTGDMAGQVGSVVIRQPGSGYVNPTVSITGGGGAGATATATATPMTGNYPRLSAIFQQRQIYAASLNKPLTVWGSKPKQFNNFDVSNVVLDNDSYEFELDSDEVTPIRHMKAVRGGLLLMTDGGIWLLTGGGQNDPVTPTNVLAAPNTYIGVSAVPPIALDTDLLYVESKGYTVRLLAYNDFARLYAGEDVSIFSNHFFTSANFITEWTFADDPFKLVWARRQDGSLLSLTAVKEQKVFAWAQHWTKGLFERVLAVRTGVTDQTYAIVGRYLNGRYTKCLEMFANRRFTAIEDAFCVDCGLSLGHTYPAAIVNFVFVNETTMTVTASAGVFVSGDVGKIIRASGAKLRITAYTSATVVTATLLRDFTEVLPESEDIVPLAAASGDWTMDSPITAISGLWHLEGEDVVALVDGNVVSGLTVASGAITLPNAGTTVHIGIPYKCRAKTLALTTPQGIVENKRKGVKGIATRLHESRGLKFGTSEDNVRYTIPERSHEIMGEPNDPLNGVYVVDLMPDFENDGNVWVTQDNPLPASILSFLTDADLGDDPE